jgi:hypothetical protein
MWRAVSRLRVMFSRPQQVGGLWVTQVELDVDAVVCLSADGERLLHVAAGDLVTLSAEDLPGTYIEAVRTQRPNAYMPWTAADDAQLAELVRQGASVPELTRVFQRRYGAIRSRIRKLRRQGLIPEEG